MRHLRLTVAMSVLAVLVFGHGDSVLGLWGAKPVASNEFPWMVAFFKNESCAVRGACSGVLVSKRWLVTAAHCVDDLGKGPWWASMNRYDLTQGPSGDVKAIETAIKHPDYGHHGPDIAMMALGADALTPILERVEQKPPKDQDVTLLGWGARYANDAPTGVLHQVPARISACSAPSSTHSFCLDDVKSPHTCGGDSGGAVVVGSKPAYKLAGLLTESGTCGVAGKKPSVGVSVPELDKWITCVMTSDKPKNCH